jgi:hypothetical protein
MQETRRMTEEAKNLRHKVQEQAQRAGQDFETAIDGGIEAASRSVNEINKGFQIIATEMTDFSKRRLEDVFSAWDQLLAARTLGDVLQVQSKYAQRAYEDYMSQISKVGGLFLSTANNGGKPVGERRPT